MTLLQTNAVLTRVQGAATASGEGWDGPAGAGAEKWAGEADAYVLEMRRSVITKEGPDVQTERSLIVQTGDPAVEFAAGDVVTFARTGAAADARRVVDVARSDVDDPDIPPELRTTRLVLAG